MCYYLKSFNTNVFHTEKGLDMIHISMEENITSIAAMCFFFAKDPGFFSHSFLLSVLLCFSQGLSFHLGRTDRPILTSIFTYAPFFTFSYVVDPRGRCLPYLRSHSFRE